MTELVSFKGSATELSAELADHFGLILPSNMVSKKLMQHWQELSGYGVCFENKRSHGKRWLELTYDPSGDSTDPEYVLIDGKQVPVVKFSLDDVINRSAAKIRAQVYRELGILVPEFRNET